MTTYSLDNRKYINNTISPSFKVTPSFLGILLLLACQLTPIAWLAASRVLHPTLPAAPHLQKTKKIQTSICIDMKSPNGSMKRLHKGTFI